MLLTILYIILILCASLIGWILGTWLYHAIDFSIENRRERKKILLILQIREEIDKKLEELRKEIK